jgi:hypothetical protein
MLYYVCCVNTILVLVSVHYFFAISLLKSISTGFMAPIISGYPCHAGVRKDTVKNVVMLNLRLNFLCLFIKVKSNIPKVYKVTMSFYFAISISLFEV